ncbi:nucleoside phosphorylase domain-containing protein [Aspergillus undulatus]|uniref:nucleoside phosphorylase domain-containing protein n=1 Tax=Aspergillus undulatus TaxID=1810928 RepID=UPI003CCD5D11
MKKPRFCPETYTVGWVCALPLELQAARAMLDDEHQDPFAEPHETNIYCLGRIGQHHVVIVCLPAGRYGTNAAAACVKEMMEKFRSIKFGFLVGIAGGVPSDEADVRLGDIVISQPQGQFGGVVQYDLGKIGPEGKSHRTGYLTPPPTMLLNALSKFRALGRDQSSHIIARLPLTGGVQKPDSDVLYEPTYDHIGKDRCQDCDPTRVKQRGKRANETLVHYGLIASGNQVVKDGVTRDRLSRELGYVLCFEMEAAGVMNTLPCLVIRGICDYCDSHKNKDWQIYAAMMAALCAKDFFDIIPGAQATRLTADQETRERFEAVFMTDPLIDRANIINAKGTRVEGTCEWLRNDESYKSWLGPQGPPFLWLCGGPGKGKTMLSIFLTQELEKLKGGGLIFYFCGHEDEKRNTATAVLRGLIYQVVEKRPSLFRHAQFFFASQQKAEYALESPEALWTILWAWYKTQRLA